MSLVSKAISALNAKVKGIEFIFNHRGLLDSVVGTGTCVLNTRRISVAMSPFELSVKAFSHKTRADPCKTLTWNRLVFLCVVLFNYLSFHSSWSRLLGLLLDYVMGRLRKQIEIAVLWWWSGLGLQDQSCHRNQTRKLCDALYEGVWAAWRVWHSDVQHGNT